MLKHPRLQRSIPALAIKEMHTFWSRLNQSFFFALSVILATGAANSLTSYLFTANPSAAVVQTSTAFLSDLHALDHIISVLRRTRVRDPKFEVAHMKFDISAGMTVILSLCHSL